MVVFYLKHSLAPSGKVVPVTVALSKEVLSPYPDPAFPALYHPEGDGVWILTLSTNENDVDGNPIPTEFVNIVSEDTVHIELEAALGRIGSKVDWGNISSDDRPPRLVELNPPLTQTEDVPISSNIKMRIQDRLPSSGLDLSTLNVRLNGFQIVTSGVVQPGYDVDLKGNIFDLTVVHRPVKILS